MEAIRRQNFAERRHVSHRAAAAVYHPHVPMAKPELKQEIAALPTFDPEERRRKVAALKVHTMCSYTLMFARCMNNTETGLEATKIKLVSCPCIPILIHAES